VTSYGINIDPSRRPAPRPARRSGPRTGPRIPAGLAAIILTLVATLGGALVVATPASAHDELVSSDPAADATLDALPAEITLTFSGLISTEAGANEIAVTDASGTSLVDGAPTVSDTVVTQKLTGAASGAITVLWKVVSSDGHPISDQYSFTVTGAPAPTAAPTTTPTATPSESATATQPAETPAETATPTAAPTEDASSADVWPWVIGAVIVLAIAGALIYLLTSRGRRERALADASQDGAEAPPGDGSEPPLDR